MPLAKPPAAHTWGGAGRWVFRIALVLVVLLGTALQLRADARAEYSAGRSALEDRDYFRAVERFGRALEENPDYREALVGMAEAYYRLEEYDEALGYIDEARRLARRDPAVLALAGQVRLALGSVGEARELFEEAVEADPNSVDGRIGLAELAIAEGNTARALQRYRDVVRLDPRDRQALLSLALVYEARGERETAEEYLQLALEHHSRHPEVQLLAAEYYYRAREYEAAVRHAQAALSLRPAHHGALLLLGSVSLHRERYDEAIAYTEQLLGLRRDNPAAWYVRAVAHRELGELESALDAFEAALDSNPEAETVRYALEQLVLAELDLEDERRAEYAAYHFRRADGLENQNQFRRALASYRRGLRLDPYDRDARVAYAEMHRAHGNRATYLQQLEVLADLGFEDDYIRDRIEASRAMLRDAPAARWDLDQFGLARDRVQVSLFTIPHRNAPLYPVSDLSLTQTLRDELLAYERVSVTGGSEAVHEYAEAFRAAREDGSQYFAVIEFVEEERRFTARAELHLSRTGAELGSVHSQREGNMRVREALARVAEGISRRVPLIGRLVERDFGRGVVSVGRLDGVEEDDELAIVRRSAVIPRSGDGGYLYDRDDRVGSFLVTSVDDMIAEGEIRRRDFVDTINLGDTVLLERDLTEASETVRMFPPLYRRIRSIQ